LGKALKEGGWIWIPYPGGINPINHETPAVGVTIANRIVVAASPEQMDVAQALAAALTDSTIIGMENTTTLTSGKSNMLAVIVGTKR
jgi:hypothetical protein